MDNFLYLTKVMLITFNIYLLKKKILSKPLTGDPKKRIRGDVKYYI